MTIEERIESLPSSPGVYLMKDNAGVVLYIGKAKDLRVRVRSYFQRANVGRFAIPFLLSRVADIDYIVTTNEKEALILEDTLLKKYKPRYNIRLKDDKTYVSIKLTVEEDFPRISVTRQIKKDGSRYFGPYASAHKVRETLRFLRHLFPLCTCSATEFRLRVRPCLDYQMGICSAPCVALIPKDVYRELVNEAILFLEGRNQALIKTLKNRMEAVSQALEFEKASRIRDQIKAIEASLEEQRVVSQKDIDRDIFALVKKEDDTVLVQALYVREGRLTWGRDYIFKVQGLPMEEVLSSFITQHYMAGRFIPEEVILPLSIDDKGLLEDWLTDRKGERVRIFCPRRGERLRLLEMAERNAHESLKKRQALVRREEGILEDVKERLRLKKVPRLIEAFDISNIGGRLAVGAMVVFEDGRPNKDRYRRFKIETLEGPDDYGMMEEILSRRYRRAIEVGGLPALILLDGGKGQLNIALKVLEGLGVRDIDVVALAKEKVKGIGQKVSNGERVYLPDVKDPVVLREGSPPDLLLRMIRDEVHRFAIAYHKKLRKKGIGSMLVDIPGVGEKRCKALLSHFGSLERIRGASVEDILKVPGMTRNVAEAVKKALSHQIPCQTREPVPGDRL
ncbi:MAG: excinuclease ABC subunit UvrC [Deltaproteobacteria bacterium]|nr:excinuclease ABC subunit UvrC [Deltaproteobacteria bacterium]